MEIRVLSKDINKKLCFIRCRKTPQNHQIKEEEKIFLFFGKLFVMDQISSNQVSVLINCLFSLTQASLADSKIILQLFCNSFPPDTLNEEYMKAPTWKLSENSETAAEAPKLKMSLRIHWRPSKILKTSKKV